MHFSITTQTRWHDRVCSEGLQDQAEFRNRNYCGQEVFIRLADNPAGIPGAAGKEVTGVNYYPAKKEAVA